jgi:hypothetical protein
VTLTYQNSVNCKINNLLCDKIASKAGRIYRAKFLYCLSFYIHFTLFIGISRLHVLLCLHFFLFPIFVQTIAAFRLLRLCLFISSTDTNAQYKKIAITVQYCGDFRYRSIKLHGQRRSHGPAPALCFENRDCILNCHSFRVHTDNNAGPRVG